MSHDHLVSCILCLLLDPSQDFSRVVCCFRPTWLIRLDDCDFSIRLFFVGCTWPECSPIEVPLIALYSSRWQDELARCRVGASERLDGEVVFAILRSCQFQCSVEGDESGTVGISISDDLASEDLGLGVLVEVLREQLEGLSGHTEQLVSGEAKVE